jgi:hypothetical protein
MFIIVINEFRKAFAAKRLAVGCHKRRPQKPIHQFEIILSFAAGWEKSLEIAHPIVMSHLVDLATKAAAHDNSQSLFSQFQNSFEYENANLNVRTQVHCFAFECVLLQIQSTAQ